MKNNRVYLFFAYAIIAITLLAACGDETAAEPLEPLAAEGKKLFAVHCASCHAASGETVIVGPSLAGVATRAETREEGLSATQYLAASILKPSSYVVDGYDDLMPSEFGIKLTGEEMDNIIIYLETLK